MDDLTAEELDALLAEPVPLSYWLDPRHLRHEITYLMYAWNWRSYCWQHDRIHWAWTHRKCGCWRTSSEGRRMVALISDLLNRDRRSAT